MENVENLEGNEGNGGNIKVMVPYNRHDPKLDLLEDLECLLYCVHNISNIFIYYKIHLPSNLLPFANSISIFMDVPNVSNLKCSVFLLALIFFLVCYKSFISVMGFTHRVSIEGKPPYKESYTLNSCQKMFDDVCSDVGACIGLLEIRISS